MTEPDFAPYLRAWRARARQERAARRRAVRKALEEARRIADVLVSEYGATQVWLFGSLARALQGGEGFHERSDIDLAVDRIQEARYYAAVGQALHLASRPVQIVDLTSCSPALAEAVRREGICLRGSAGADAAAPRRAPPAIR